MTWFKENKFLAGLICITFLIAAVIIFLGTKFSSSLTGIKDEISTKQSKLAAMKNLNPYPTIESAKEKKANLVTVLEKENAAREKLLAFRPEALTEVTGAVFSQNLTSAVSKVKALFPNEDALPKSFNLGFEDYSGGPPKEGATGVLTYQLGAMEYLFENIASAGISEVQNLSRIKLPAEKGEDWPNATGSRGGSSRADRGRRGRTSGGSRSRGGNRGSRKKNPFEDLPPVAHRMPFELVVKAPEAALRQFLTQISNSEEYFFETRLFRVLNPSPIPSSGKSASAAKPKKDNDFGADFAVEGEEDSADAVVSEQILNKVSGGDELVLYLRADLLLFIAEQKFPELK